MEDFIPSILRWSEHYPEFKFIPLGKWNDDHAKAPIERGWKKDRHYAASDYRMHEFIFRGHNYGVCTGFGDLVVLDADDPSLTVVAREFLPATLEVRTGRKGGGGIHSYFKCKLEKSIRLIERLENRKVKHIGELQSHGKMVVGPGSRHPSGSHYHFVNSNPIAEVTEAKLREVFSEWIRKPVKKGCSVKTNLVGLRNLNVGSLVNCRDLKQSYNGDYQGAHPVHGSSGGHNFSINPDKNVWFCYRHDTGGGPLLLLAVIEGIIDCGEAHNGILSGEVLEETIKIARTKYGLGV